MTFTAEEKLKSVLDGLARENSITELCKEYNISRQTYYDWKEQMIEATLNNWNNKQVGRNARDNVSSLDEAKEKIKELQQKQENLKEKLKQATKQSAIYKLQKDYLKFRLTEDDIDPDIKAKNKELFKKKDSLLNTNNGS
jgi:transposase